MHDRDSCHPWPTAALSSICCSNPLLPTGQLRRGNHWAGPPQSNHSGWRNQDSCEMQHILCSSSETGRAIWQLPLGLSSQTPCVNLAPADPTLIQLKQKTRCRAKPAAPEGCCASLGQVPLQHVQGGSVKGRAASSLHLLHSAHQQQGDRWGGQHGQQEARLLRCTALFCLHTVQMLSCRRDTH